MDYQPAGYLVPAEITATEQEVLDEYERLNENMRKLADLIGKLSGPPSHEIIDGLRNLERQTSVVFTSLKASVYSIVLQQGIVYGPSSTEASQGSRNSIERDDMKLDVE